MASSAGSGFLGTGFGFPLKMQGGEIQAVQGAEKFGSPST